jgi:hypothetical protein
MDGVVSRASGVLLPWNHEVMIEILQMIAAISRLSGKALIRERVFYRSSAALQAQSVRSISLSLSHIIDLGTSKVSAIFFTSLTSAHFSLTCFLGIRIQIAK